MIDKRTGVWIGELTCLRGSRARLENADGGDASLRDKAASRPIGGDAGALALLTSFVPFSLFGWSAHMRSRLRFVGVSVEMGIGGAKLTNQIAGKVGEDNEIPPCWNGACCFAAGLATRECAETEAKSRLRLQLLKATKTVDVVCIPGWDPQ